MILEGQAYLRDRQTDEKTYWRCENHKSLNCHYRIHTCSSTSTNVRTHVVIVKRHGTHSTACHRDPIKISLRRFYEQIVDRANNTQEPTDAVLSQCLSKQPDPIRLRLPALDHVKRTIQHHRKKNDLPPTPNDIDFPSVSTALRSTKRNETFLRIGTGPGKTNMEYSRRASMYYKYWILFSRP